MKEILLLGDSIRQNYQKYVAKQMKGWANISFPNDNGRFCQYTLRYLHDWIRILSDNDKEFDIVHFNCGLWDVLRLSNEQEIFTDEETYKKLLYRIYKRIKYLCPNARIIFALTTKVIEPGFGQAGLPAIRYNKDIKRYNEIAKQLFLDLEVEVNDLWSISEKLPKEAYSDYVHFDTVEGIQALGGQVVKCLKQHLQGVA